MVGDIDSKDESSLLTVRISSTILELISKDKDVGYNGTLPFLVCSTK